MLSRPGRSAGRTSPTPNYHTRFRTFSKMPPFSRLTRSCSLWGARALKTGSSGCRIHRSAQTSPVRTIARRRERALTCRPLPPSTCRTGTISASAPGVAGRRAAHPEEGSSAPRGRRGSGTGCGAPRSHPRCPRLPPLLWAGHRLPGVGRAAATQTRAREFFSCCCRRCPPVSLVSEG